MTTPTLFDNDTDIEELRKRWLNKYLKVQAPVDKKVRDVLILAAENAYNQLIAETSKSSFSATVKSAQLRISLKEIREILRALFGDIKPIIEAGQRDGAGVAFDAFTDTDREYLKRAFLETLKVLDPRANEKDVRRILAGYIRGARVGAINNVQHSINSLTKSDHPLSVRVYRAEKLANNWVKNQVAAGIASGTDPRKIAIVVKNSIRPSTPGGVSYAAMRLARTEVNNAFHATSISIAEDRPWVKGMKWNRSKVYNPKSTCICQRLANQIFTVSQVPAKPHPQCRCFVTPEVEAWDSFLRHLTAGQYRSWLSDAA